MKTIWIKGMKEGKVNNINEIFESYGLTPKKTPEEIKNNQDTIKWNYKNIHAYIEKHGNTLQISSPFEHLETSKYGEMIRELYNKLECKEIVDGNNKHLNVDIFKLKNK